jgi:Fe-S oxidoreductase
VKRTLQLIDTGATTIASACPFCMTMLGDGLKAKDGEDIASSTSSSSRRAAARRSRWRKRRSNGCPHPSRSAPGAAEWRG